jgi:hypothetical protein
VSRCEWNPAISRPATDPSGEGDCPNGATLSVGATGRFHLCASCAALPTFSALKKRTPLDETPEQRLARLVAMTPEETVRDLVEKAKEADMHPGLGATYARMMIWIVETLAETPAGARVVLKAMKTRAGQPMSAQTRKRRESGGTPSSFGSPATRRA